MAWTTPRTWNAGETVTSIMMNTHVRDNLSYLYQSAAINVGAAVVRTSTQSISSAVSTAISWSSAGWDTDSLWSGGDPTKLTIPAGMGGLWYMAFYFRWDLIAVNNVRIIGSLLVNGGVVQLHENSTSTTQYQSMSLALITNLSAADYLTVTAYQNTGGAVNVRANENYLEAIRLGDTLS